MDEGKKALYLDTLINGVKYECGCVCGSDKLVPFMFFSKSCLEHGNPVMGFWRKDAER